ncbi:MAG: Kiwa anti-phage protein KwaB-like domain-containing protein, partial [Methanoregula sp.]|uniref:Kiwa anti-phage protein KwaB-like domain-containing protein n=1 Tax=Methanoregula sp. TaxID=2052170 RepID=UPI003C753B3F
IGYDILPCTDGDTVIETLPLKDVPHLSEFIAGIADKNIKIITKKDLSKIHGYAVRIENEINTIYLFKKNTPKRLLEKDKIAYFFGAEGQFSEIDDQIITIEKIFDAAVLIPNPKNPAKITKIDTENFWLSDVYIFFHYPFESFFDFKEAFSLVIENNRGYLEETKLVDSVDNLVSYCGDNARLIKKLARIVTAKQLDATKIEKLKEVALNYKLNVKFSKKDGEESEKLTVENDTIREVLHLLDDDYGKSEIRNQKCLMITKNEIH